MIRLVALLFALSGAQDENAAQGDDSPAPVENDQPITRVVKLIEGLKGRIEDDEKRENVVWMRYACWCENMTNKKATTIENTRNEVMDAANLILQYKAESADLQHRIEENEKTIAETKEEIAQLTRTREEEKALFEKNVEEATANINTLTSALDTIKEKAGINLLQMNMPQFMAVAKAVTKAVDSGMLTQRQIELAQTVLMPDRHNMALTAEHSDPDPFNPPEGMRKSSTEDDSYAPQSMTILGILEDMRNQFKNDIKEWTREEERKLKNFEDLISQNEESLKTEKADMKQNRKDKATANNNEAEQQERHTSDSEQLAHDADFFEQTKKACGEKKDAWDLRQKMRHEELAGIDEALKLLTNPKHRELFGKSIKPGQETVSFLQMQSPRFKALKSLKIHARQSHSLRLAALAYQMKTSKTLKDVVKQINEMMEKLDKEEKKDFKDRDVCQANTQEWTEAKKDFLWKKDVAKSEEDVKTSNKKEAKDRRKENLAEQKEANNTITQLTEEREDEHRNYIQEQGDDTKASELLTEVIEHLTKFYKKNTPDENMQAFTQQDPVFDVSEEQAPDAVFSDRASRAGESKGIIATITMIRNDLRNEIKQGKVDEANSQKEYADQKSDLEKTLDELETEQTNLETTIARLDGEIDGLQKEQTSNQNSATENQDYIDADKPSCDNLIQTFDQRREKRRLEKEGLRQARDYLAAAPEKPELIQTPQDAFVNDSFSAITPHIF